MNSRRETREVRELVAAAIRLRRDVLAPALAASIQAQASELGRLRPEHFTGQPPESWLSHLVEEASGSWIAVGLLLRLTEDFGLAPYLNGRDETEARGNGLFSEVASWARRLGSLVLPREHPVFQMGLPEEALHALLNFFREEVKGAPRWRAAAMAPSVMADLFSELTEMARREHAFIATPDFVAEFLVERTLAPAALEFGLENLRVLDPACGSGLLLSAAFRELLKLRAPGTSRVDARVARAALEQLHGADISPFACAWTRCALLRAVLQSVSEPQGLKLWKLPLNISQGNSLLAHVRAPNLQELQRQYHVVLVEPPFITEHNPVLRKMYRTHFESASRRFSLDAPFLELAFNMAVDNGFVSALVSSSFTKREFGKPLIERVLARQELTSIIDASGAYLPGHGTPTVMLFARHRPPFSSTVRTVVCRRGEPITPSEPREGKVWTELRRHVDTPGFQGAFITVMDRSRQDFARHPWSLLPAEQVTAQAVLERKSAVRLGEVLQKVTRARVSFAEVMAEPATLLRNHVPGAAVRVLVQGESLADWSLGWDEVWAVPDLTAAHASSGPPLLLRSLPGLARLLPSSTGEQEEFYGAVARLFSSGLSTPEPRRILGVPVVARQNHFCRIRSDRFFPSSVGRIELSCEHLDEEQALALLAYLNSSTAWFWLQTALPAKVLHAFEGQYRRDLDARHMLFEFSLEALMRLPIPAAVLEPGQMRQGLAACAQRLETLARKHRRCSPRFVLGLLEEPGEPGSSGTGSPWDGKSRTSLVRALAWARHDEELLLREMVVQQEEIDWLLYSALGLAQVEPIHKARALPEHRPSAWLQQEPPVGISPDLATEWGARRRQRESSPLLQVFDEKSCKRSWVTRKSVAKDGGHDHRRVHDACVRWLLMRTEQVFQVQRSPVLLTVMQLAEAVSSDPAAVSVAQILESTTSVNVAGVLSALIEDETVPFLASWRLSPRGLLKFNDWQELWMRQRIQPVTLEDARRLAISFEPGDFQRSSYWRLRGRLDFPRERFIGYPGMAASGRETLYGWAGWTLPQQVEVLKRLYLAGRDEAWTTERLLPIVQGLEELVPWIRFWHSSFVPGLQEVIDMACGELGVEQRWR